MSFDNILRWKVKIGEALIMLFMYIFTHKLARLNQYTEIII